jgi:hypothetical protein
MGRRTTAKTIGKCKKFWLLFPGTDENLEHYKQSAGFNNRLARIGSQLRGGIMARTDSTQVLDFPVNTLHSVFTVVGGFLASINYSAAECLPAMSRFLQIHIPDLHISQTISDAVSENIQSFIDAFSSTLDMELERFWFPTLQSWVDLQVVIQRELDSGKKLLGDFRRKVELLNNCLERFGRNHKGMSICGCGRKVGHIGTHVIQTHKIALPLVKKRKRSLVRGGSK